MGDTPQRLVIFGYGNPSRGDDALGPELLRRLAERQDACKAPVSLVEDFQLQPEHALDLGPQTLALFMDASVSCSPPYVFGRIRPEQDASYTSHALSPAAVLHVYESVHHTPAPPAFLLTVRGERFGLGDPVSQAARLHLEAAYEFLVRLCRQPSAESWLRLACAPADRGGPGTGE